MKTRNPLAMGLALAGSLAIADSALAADRIEKTFNLQPGGRFAWNAFAFDHLGMEIALKKRVCQDSRLHHSVPAI